LEQRKNTGTKKAGGCVCLQPKESRTKDDDENDDEEDWGRNQALRMRGSFRTEALELGRTAAFELSAIVLIVGPKLFIEPGAKAFFQLSSVSDPGL
jgi:hypothetical protein